MKLLSMLLIFVRLLGVINHSKLFYREGPHSILTFFLKVLSFLWKFIYMCMSVSGYFLNLFFVCSIKPFFSGQRMGKFACGEILFLVSLHCWLNSICQLSIHYSKIACKTCVQKMTAKSLGGFHIFVKLQAGSLAVKNELTHKYFAWIWCGFFEISM